MEVFPIGFFSGDAVYKYDAPRQGKLFAGHPGRIDLLSGYNFEMALRNIQGFERIWVIFQFHENEGWRPTTKPPVSAPGLNRVGVFASRSPYRPNSIGLSCVKLLRVEGLSLFVDEADLLEGTPILDIKPYIPMADSFPNAKAGWVDLQNLSPWEIEKKNAFEEKSIWIKEKLSFDLESFAFVQLSHSPEDSSRHRVLNKGIFFELAYRTFRILFELDKENKRVILKDVVSGYSLEDLESSEDKYGDKPVHRLFVEKWGRYV